MKIKTSELIGAPLDWAVAKCEGIELFPWPNGTLNVYRPVTDDYAVYEPHCRWAQGGPIMEREKISVLTCTNGHEWAAKGAHNYSYGPTALIAACRAFVAARLGESVEVPDELVKETT